jgi:hypothetical protein
MTRRSAQKPQMAGFAAAAKYRDVREGGVLEEGIAVSVRMRDLNTRTLQRGANEIGADAVRMRGLRRANRTGRVQRQTANSLIEPNKT